MIAQAARERKACSCESLLDVMAIGIFAPMIIPQLFAVEFICRVLIIRLPAIRFGTTTPSNSQQYGQS